MKKTLLLLFFLITLQVAVKAQNRIYWGIPSKNISSAKLDGTDVKQSVALSGQTFDMETDFYKGILYWGDYHSVKKANTDGTNLQTLHTGSNQIGGLALDLINNKLYFSDYGSGNVIIRRCNLDGTGMEVIVTSPNSNLYTYNLTISPTLQKLYWTESTSSNANSIIMRCNLDGTNIETLLITTNFIPGLTIDEKNQRLYLAYWNDNKVMTTDMTCSTTPTLVFGSSNGTFQMAVSNVDDKLYFGEMSTNKIRSCNLDGSSPQDIVSGLSGRPMALSIPTVPPAPTIHANETYTFELNDFLFASVDKNLLTKIKITTLTDKGALYLDANNNNIVDAGEEVVLNQEISKTDIVAGTLKFNPVANDYGSPYTTFNFKWFDGTSYSTLDYLQYIYVLSIAPTVTTQAVSDIGSAAATGNGNITDLGVPFPTSYGVCWNTTGSPTTSNNKVDLGATSATGTFTAAITGLTANTTYKVRAYATNEAGTSYGTEVTFTTNVLTPPTATTNAATSITTTGATLNGSINANNTSTTVAFEYGLTTSYGTTVTADQSPVTGTSESAVSCTLSGLTQNTEYHFRVKAVNAAGTTYGDDFTFTTPPIVPTITSFTPASGIIGSTVTITGTNYSTTIADNEVYVGSLKAIITACTATSITFTIPTGAVSGTIKVVLKNGEQVLSATNLVILGSPSFTSTPVTTIGYNETYNYNVDATTEGSLTTSITAPTLPAWLTLNGQNGGLPKSIGNIPAEVNIGGATEDNNGNTYAITYKYDNSTNTIYKIAPDGTTTIWKSGLIAWEVFELCIANGYIYIPRYANNSNSITRIPLNNPNAAEENFASLTMGALALKYYKGWIYASDYLSKQIVRINETTKAIETVLSSSDGIPNAGPFGLDFDQDGNLFIATYSNSSILKYNTSTHTLSTVLSGLPNYVTSVKVDKQGNFYVALDGGGLRKYKPDFSSYELISLNANDNVWGLSMTEAGSITYSSYNTNQVYRIETGAVLHGQPTKSDIGSHNVVLRATNTAGYTEQSFTINVVDNVAPVVSAYSPNVNATDVSLQPALSLTFDEEIRLGTTGVLSIYNGATLVKSYDLSVAADKALFTLSSDKKTVSITLSEDLPVNTLLSIGLGAGFVKDVYNNDFAGFTAASNTWQFTTINKATQTITYPDIAPKTYGDATFTLGNASTDKGLTVSYTADDPTVVSIAGNVATILKAGSTKITATQAGDNVTFAATAVEHTLTVNKAALTITADAKSKIYGNADPALTAQVTSGTIVTGDIASGSLSRAVGENVADYAISKGSYTFGSNYDETYVSNNLSITKRDVTVNAVTDTKTYDGTTASSVSPTVGALATGDVIATVPTQVFDNANVGSTHIFTASGLIIKNANNVDVTTNYNITYETATGVISAKQLFVTAPALTTTKVYDGNANADVTAGSLTDVVTSDMANISVNATASYSDANAGENKTITVIYVLSGSAASNYLMPVNDVYSGADVKITRKQLIISDPVVVTSKMVDGNSTAQITSVGALSGIESVDAGKVSVSSVANYDNALVGKSKTITVVYNLAGSAKDNYSAPVNFTVSNAVISDFITLSPLSIPSRGCEGSDMNLDYTILTGDPTTYKISFNQAALTAGMQNVTYTNLPTTAISGTISFAIPSGMKEGTYVGTLVMNNDFGVESVGYSFEFTVNISNGMLVTKFNKVVLIDNSDNNFVSYQWFKDGVEIAGADKQFYNDPEGLIGAYSVRVQTKDGQTLYSCEKVLNITTSKKVTAYPNPLKEDQDCTVKMEGFDSEEFENADLQVFDVRGVCIYKSTKVEKTNYINFDTLSGVYVGQFTTADGAKYMFKILVEK